VKLFVQGCCFTLLFTLANAHAFDATRIKENKSIVIAHRESALPISYLSAENKPIGFAMDICNKVIERIKREWKLPQLSVSHLLVNSGNRMTAIIEANADIECGITANTAERRKQVQFSIPYFYSSTRILTGADAKIKAWTDLKDKKVAIVRGTTATALLRQNLQSKFADLKLEEVVNFHAAMNLLEVHKVDAVVAEEWSLANLRAAAVTPVQWKIVGDGLGIEVFALMLAKNDSALKAIVDKEIAHLMTEGEFVRLYEKWFMQAIPPLGINLGLPMNFLLKDSIRIPSDKVSF
jgi:glutamate/aspartate transport system substrate-binding protein